MVQLSRPVRWLVAKDQPLKDSEELTLPYFGWFPFLPLFLMRLANSLKSLVLVWQDSPYQASLGHGWGHQMNPNWVPGRQTFNCHALWSGKTNAIHRPAVPKPSPCLMGGINHPQVVGLWQPGLQTFIINNPSFINHIAKCPNCSLVESPLQMNLQSQWSNPSTSTRSWFIPLFYANKNCKWCVHLHVC